MTRHPIRFSALPAALWLPVAARFVANVDG
jgi:hypothetical protein